MIHLEGLQSVVRSAVWHPQSAARALPLFYSPQSDRFDTGMSFSLPYLNDNHSFDQTIKQKFPKKNLKQESLPKALSEIN